MIDCTDLATKIQLHRKKQRMTQRELADMVGISRTYLSMLENGTATNPSCDVVNRLSQVLSLATFDKPERTFIASCYLCQTDTGLQMVPHRKDGYMVGWIFACTRCAPQLYGAELIATLPEHPKQAG
jgi:transcriptional regulator with XRE-family HTH domain